MTCFFCDEPVGPEALRLQQGGWTSVKRKSKKYQRMQTGELVPDTFEDGDAVKWLCLYCADRHGIDVEVLRDDYCVHCNNTFEPAEKVQSDCVIMAELGSEALHTKTNATRFRVETSGFVHFMCACDEWELPLWSLDRAM